MQSRSPAPLAAIACLVLLSAAAETKAAGDAAAGGKQSAPPVLIPVGDVSLDLDESQIDEKMGGAFVLGLRSGANNCYVEALAAAPRQEGEITFVVKPPAGEGRFLVTVAKQGTLGDELVACVRSVFDAFYHSTDKVAFTQIPGTLRFAPRLISGPPPPTEAVLRATLDARYADTKMVRIASVALSSVSLDAGSSNEVLRRYFYTVDLVFVSDGYESACTHYEVYKLFTTRPYTSPYAGHTCESHARKAGEHVADRALLTFTLKLWPEVGKAWEWHGGGITGTLPSIEP